MLPWWNDAPPGLVDRVRETTLAKLVRDEMLALILRGEIAPGQRINEPDIAARLRVSRVPVREALRELESSGLVAARKHSGVFVRVLTGREIGELYELRSVLDAHAGRRAAELPAAPRQALARQLAAHVRQMSAGARSGDVQAYYASNLAFHWRIVEAAGNEQLALAYRGVVQQLHVARLSNLSDRAGMRASQAEHKGVLAALAGGDSVRCQQLLAAHVTTSYQRLQARLDELPHPPTEDSTT